MVQGVICNKCTDVILSLFCTANQLFRFNVASVKYKTNKHFNDYSKQTIMDYFWQVWIGDILLKKNKLLHFKVSSGYCPLKNIQ